MHFFGLPEEVIVGGICAYLNYNDVLRLRLVNKQVKGYADDHLKVRVAYHELEISYDTDKTLEKFNILGIPTPIRCTRLYFMIGQRFFTQCQPDIDIFLKKHADKITHLRVANFYTFSVEGELDFYGALSNLKHLQLGCIDATKRNCAVFKDGKRAIESPFPDNFKELVTLKLDFVLEYCNNGNWDVYYQWDFFTFCEKLKYFKYANNPEWHEESSDGPFSTILQAILERKVKFPNGPHLKYYDIGNAPKNTFAEPMMINLLQACVQYDVKLVNVKAKAHEFLLYARNPRDLNLVEPIASMEIRNISKDIMRVAMPNLEKISINRVGVCDVDDGFNCNPEWPKLKKLKIVWHRDDDPTQLTQLTKYLFEREKPLREQLTHLSLNNMNTTTSLPYPNAGPIIATCPNLTKLTLVSYPDPAPNTEYSKLWEGLKFLQELCLKKCTTLGLAGFVGRSFEKPAFLELKYLKKLTLAGMDEMPKITDEFFEIVLCHMKLTHFIIHSDDKPLTSISEEGILSLLFGEFGTSIKVFPFKGWSISGMRKKDFQYLGSSFGSSHYSKSIRDSLSIVNFT